MKAILLVVARLVFLGMPATLSIDTLWYLDFGKFMIDGNLPYFGFYYPYPPFFSYVILGVMYIAPVIDTFRIIAIASDLVSLVILRHILRNRANTIAGPILLAFALLPMSIIESGWNGHFEAFTNVFLLLSIYLVLNRRNVAGGLVLGLGAATKLYPILALPGLLFMLKDNKDRFILVLSAFVGYIVAGLPVMVPIWLSGGVTLPIYIPPQVPLNQVLPAGVGLVTVVPLVAFVAVRSTVFSVGHALQKLRFIRIRDFGVNRILIVLLGCGYVVLGLYAIIIPFLPWNTQNYWRYAVDMALAKGLAAILLGLLVSHYGYSMSSEDFAKRLDPPLLISSLIMLAAACVIFVTDYYGWYLLWPLPFLMLLKDRRLLLLSLTCILIVYPTFTYDNFIGLGIEEEKTWSDDFSTLEGWDSYLNLTSAPDIAPWQVAYGITSDGVGATFWCDSTQVEDLESLRNVSIVFHKNVSIPVTRCTEFVLRIGSNWDPTFYTEKFAHVAVLADGRLPSDEVCTIPIISRSGSLTNLTQIHWRETLTDFCQSNLSEITTLRIELYPQEAELAEVYIDYMYSTEYLLFHAVSPVVMALVTGPIILGLLLVKRTMGLKDSPQHG